MAASILVLAACSDERRSVTIGPDDGELVVAHFDGVADHEEFQLQLEEEALGVTFLVHGKDKGLAILDIGSPLGKLTEDFHYPNGNLTTGFGAAAVQVPFSDDITGTIAPAGTWTFSVGGYVTDAYVIVQQSVSKPVLNLELHFREDVDESAAVEDMVRNSFPVWGFELGDLMTGTYVPQTSILTTEQFATFMREQTGDVEITDPVLHVFVVDAVPMSAFGSAFIPSVGVVRGIGMAGIALVPTGDPEFDRITFTHELGHALGLFHTTEYDGTPDMLSDTATCDETSILENPEGCPDANNRMFPVLYGSESDFSPVQQQIVLGSALYGEVTVLQD